MQKISFISGALPPITGGEFYNYQLYSYLKDKGLEVEYINLHQIRLVFKLNFIPILGDVIANILVFLLILIHLGDLVIEDQFFSPYLILTNFVCKFIRRGNILVIVHHFDRYNSQEYGSYPKTMLSYPLGVIREISSVFFADYIVTNSQFNQQEILSIRSMEENTIKILPPGLDREKLKINLENKTESILQDNKSSIILCIGHCIPRKGIIYLIEAFSKINRQNFKLYIVGKTDKNIQYYNKVQSLIEQLELSQEIYLLNRVEQKTLISLYSQAEFFVLPSLKEGFGIVLLEAMYYGLPIITTNVSAIPELVIDGENGLLVNPSDANDLAKALSILIENPDLRQKMSKNGRQRIEEGYYWEQTKSQFLSVVQKLLACS